MDIFEVLVPLPVSSTYQAAPAVIPDAGFDARWAAWMERGHAHDRRAQRRLVVWASLITTGAAVVYALLRS